jgi:hypothetical protein
VVDFATQRNTGGGGDHGEVDHGEVVVHVMPPLMTVAMFGQRAWRVVSEGVTAKTHRTQSDVQLRLSRSCCLAALSVLHSLGGERTLRLGGL